MSESASDRARQRLRDELERKKLNQADVARLLKWTESRVSKAFNRHTELGLDELSALCFAVGLSPVEAVRDHGLEFLAEMTPTELRMIERYRELPQNVRDAVLTVLAVPAVSKTTERRAMARQIPAYKKKIR